MCIGQLLANSQIVWLLLLCVMSVMGVYNLPSYYGHFSRKYFLYEQIKAAKFTYFEYHFAVDVDRLNNTFYVAETGSHCIKVYNQAKKQMSILAGICGTPGDRVGDLSIMQMNNPRSVVLYEPDHQARLSQENMRIVVTRNKQCLLSEARCILSEIQASSFSLSMQNLRASPPILMFPQGSAAQERYLYVSDTNNHCIKRISLSINTSEVVAGECGVSGFKDGPKGFNKLNKPSSLGVNKLGVVYFYDQGNQYMRKLNPNGEVHTFKNGACKQFGINRTVAHYTLRQILCYDNWIEGETKSDISHYIQPSQINICIQHSSKC